MKKQNNADKPQDQTISSSNFFVMERPSAENKGTFIIKTEEYHKVSSEKDELYQESLYDVVLNLANRLTDEDHMRALRLVTPTFALHMFGANSVLCKEIIEDFLSASKDKEDIKYIKSIGEEVSQLEMILRINFKTFIVDKKKSLTNALKNHEDFLADVEDSMEFLPICYCFNLIDFLLECETNYKKTKRK